MDNELDTFSEGGEIAPFAPEVLAPLSQPDVMGERTDVMGEPPERLLPRPELGGMTSAEFDALHPTINFAAAGRNVSQTLRETWGPDAGLKFAAAVNYIKLHPEHDDLLAAQYEHPARNTEELEGRLVRSYSIALVEAVKNGD